MGNSFSLSRRRSACGAGISGPRCPERQALVAMLLIVAWSLVGLDRAWATATMSTLASAILSADTAGGRYTALTGPALAESDNNDMSAGTIILTAPTGLA